jgi:hypothetical protein
MKKILFIIFISLTGCSYMFDNLEIYEQQISVNLYMNEIIDETTVKVYTEVRGASQIEIIGKGHCYLFNSTKLPDTSDFVAPGIEYSGDFFLSLIGYSAGNDSLFIRAYIVFGDSIVYSNRGMINLNN